LTAVHARDVRHNRGARDIDVLDRLLRHDAWTNDALLGCCERLPDHDLDQTMGIGLGTVRGTFIHMVGNMELWTDLVDGRPVRTNVSDARASSATALRSRFAMASADLAAVSSEVLDAGRLDAFFLDTLDQPPTRKTSGSAIVHVATHNMHHRAQLLFMLRRLGLSDLPEGDVLTWEQQREHTG
jgi:uncharacterized damage-inducible protein DinB